MQTHKITLSYPTSWLTVNVEIRNRTTNAVLESGVAVENGTTATYDYDFDWDDNTDYIYIASVSWLNTIKGAVFYEAASGWWGGGASVSDIWTAQISDYSWTPWSFANKFEQYGGVSHVIDRSSLDDVSKAELKSFKEKMDEFNKTLKEFKSNEKDFDKIVEAIKNNPSKTTIVNKDSKYEETIWELLVESLPQLIEKLDSATEIIPLYEELINYMDAREKDWEQLVEDIINNK